MGGDTKPNLVQFGQAILHPKCKVIGERAAFIHAFIEINYTYTRLRCKNYDSGSILGHETRAIESHDF